LKVKPPYKSTLSDLVSITIKHIEESESMFKETPVAMLMAIAQAANPDETIKASIK